MNRNCLKQRNEFEIMHLILSVHYQNTNIFVKMLKKKKKDELIDIEN